MRNVAIDLLTGPGIGEIESEVPTRGVNETSQWIVLPGTWIAVAVICVIAYRMCRTHHSVLPLAMVLGAAVNSLNEPLYDKLFHLSFWEPGQWTLFETYGYAQPTWLMAAYVIYFCVPGLYIFHRLAGGTANRQWALKAGLATAVWGAAFETFAINIGLFGYFGEHPFRVLDYPMWIGLMEGAHIAMWAMLLAAFAPVLTGRRALLAVPAFAVTFCSVMFGAGGIALGTINVSDPNTALMYLGAIASVGVAWTLVHLVSLLHPSGRPASAVETFLREAVKATPAASSTTSSTA